MRTPNFLRYGAGLLLAWSALMAVAATAAEHPQEARFSSRWDGRWQARESEGQCLLEVPVNDYGMARFVAGPGLPLRFELIGRRDLLASHGVSARTVAPSWHPRYPHSGAWQRVDHVPGYGVGIDNPQASRLLMDFYEGFEQQLGANGVYGTAPSLLLTLSVIKFRAAYDDFMRCQQGSRPSSLLALHRSRVQFATGKHTILRKAGQRLREVARYVQQDPRVARVYVDGYTDDVGSDRANVALSKRRAHAVADALAAAGVDRALLRVRFHGERYPVAADGSAASRARNRRTTVRVELSGKEVAGRSAE